MNFTGRIKNIGTPADNDLYYQEVIKEFKINLRVELGKNGFRVFEQEIPGFQGFVIKTKIGEYPAPLGGWLGIMAMGVVVAQIEVYQNNIYPFRFKRELIPP